MCKTVKTKFQKLKFEMLFILNYLNSAYFNNDQNVSKRICECDLILGDNIVVLAEMVQHLPAGIFSSKRFEKYKSYG